jgi:hypothetical protein
MPVAAVGLAETVVVGNRLQDRKLPGSEVYIPHVAGEQAVRALTGSMQKMEGEKEAWRPGA